MTGNIQYSEIKRREGGLNEEKTTLWSQIGYGKICYKNILCKTDEYKHEFMKTIMLIFSEVISQLSSSTQVCYH